jgi:hypothetical protein
VSNKPLIKRTATPKKPKIKNLTLPPYETLLPHAYSLMIQRFHMTPEDAEEFDQEYFYGYVVCMFVEQTDSDDLFPIVIQGDMQHDDPHQLAMFALDSASTLFGDTVANEIMVVDVETGENLPSFKTEDVMNDMMEAQEESLMDASIPSDRTIH